MHIKMIDEKIGLFYSCSKRKIFS